MTWRPNEAVVAHVTKSNKEQGLSLEARFRKAHDLPEQEVKTSVFHRYREHILVGGLMASILIGSFAVYLNGAS